MDSLTDLMSKLSQRPILTQALLVVGIALVTTSLLMMLRKRRAKASRRISPHEQIERNQQHRGMRGDLEDLMVEIEQLSKRFGAQLNAKSIQLENLMEEADRRIAELQHLQANPPSASQDPQTLPDFAPTENGLTGLESQATVGEDPLSKAVFALADQGHPPEDIARKLDEHVGKIELILALRNT